MCKHLFPTKKEHSIPPAVCLRQVFLRINLLYSHSTIEVTACLMVDMYQSHSRMILSAPLDCEPGGAKFRGLLILGTHSKDMEAHSSYEA